MLKLSPELGDFGHSQTLGLRKDGFSDFHDRVPMNNAE